MRVRDYGHGIPPEHIPLLFNRFVRLPRDLTSNVTGNGLGLYISKGYVEAMGGRIWVESTGEAGAGSTFVMRLLLPSDTPILVQQTQESKGHDTFGQTIANRPT